MTIKCKCYNLQRQHMPNGTQDIYSKGGVAPAMRELEKMKTGIAHPRVRNTVIATEVYAFSVLSAVSTQLKMSPSGNATCLTQDRSHGALLGPVCARGSVAALSCGNRL